MKILVIRYSSIGDILLTTPIVRALKTQTNAELHFMTKQIYIPLLQHNPYIDRIITHEGDFHNAHDSGNYDVLIDLHVNLRSLILKIKDGTRHLSASKRSLEKYQYLLSGKKSLQLSHIVDHYFDQLSSLGIVNDGKGLDMFYSQAYPLKFSTQGILVVIALGGSSETKRVPVHLLNDILKEDKYNYILIGGEDIRAETAPAINVLNLVGKVTLLETASIIDQADIVISGDTGVMHMACAFQKKMVVVWGSTSPDLGIFPYYGADHDTPHLNLVDEQLSCRPCSKYGRKKCPMGHMACLNSLSGQNLSKKMHELLRRAH